MRLIIKPSKLRKVLNIPADTEDVPQTCLVLMTVLKSIHSGLRQSLLPKCPTQTQKAFPRGPYLLQLSISLSLNIPVLNKILQLQILEVGNSA